MNLNYSFRRIIRELNDAWYAILTTVTSIFLSWWLMVNYSIDARIIILVSFMMWWSGFLWCIYLLDKAMEDCQ
ncbi:MAG: hypothetical protein MRT15_09765 [archaeon YNP-LCB-003-016]|nr:hypothetical protein [Candidatus Culexarchaeum yellowstonense]